MRVYEHASSSTSGWTKPSVYTYLLANPCISTYYTYLHAAISSLNAAVVYIHTNARFIAVHFLGPVLCLSLHSEDETCNQQATYSYR